MLNHKLPAIEFSIFYILEISYPLSSIFSLFLLSPGKRVHTLLSQPMQRVPGKISTYVQYFHREGLLIQTYDFHIKINDKTCNLKVKSAIDTTQNDFELKEFKTQSCEFPMFM